MCPKFNFVFPLLLTAFLCTCVRAQSDIPVSFPTDFITQFQDVHVDEAGVGLAVGTCGVIRRTTNAGAMWTSFTSPLEDNIESVACPPSGCATALVVSEEGFHRLANGSWSAVNYPDFTSDGQLHWLSENIVINDYRSITFDRSTDGGQTWSTIDFVSNPNTDIAVLDATTLMAWINNQLFKSTDAGASFQPVDYTHPVAVREQTWLDANRGWIFDGDRLFYGTTDGGQTWTLLNATIQLTSVNWMVALSETYIVGAQVTTQRLESRDGGVTWTRSNFLNNGNKRINEKYHRRGNEFFTVGNQSQLLYSAADFENFEELDPYGREDRIDDIVFASNSLGYALSGIELKVTTDAGVNWVTRNMPRVGRELAVLNNGDLIVMTDANPQRSNDQGANFTDWLAGNVFVSTPNMFVRKPNDNIYLLGTEHAYESTDEGQTWSVITHANNFQPTAAFFVDNNNGYAVGRQSQYATTSDGGQTWTVGAGPANNSVDVFFIDADNGWVSDASTRYVTSDRGTTWTRDTDRNGGYDYTVRSQDGSILVSRFASGNNGEVARSRDNGATWDVIAFNCFSYRGGGITPDGRYWFSTGDGFMVRHDLEALLVSNPRIEAASALHLRAFPNPSTGAFTLELPVVNEAATLDIFDGSGRLLQQQTVPPGRERVLLSLGDVPTGVYLVRWTAGGQLGRVRVVKGE
ncbi:T9SS type A sorting domain-containing protein [Neolewinella persica]|uniref:T9SS type A sorting domain-containing protein n=1 Tax=Neolewinella persica TaxID=70998 RepID=UPI000365C128|nr:T9SS type A sorting domain-containing protein [Neolewinella persica]